MAGIRINNSRGVVINRVTVEGFDVGVVVERSSDVRVANSDLSNNVTGLSADDVEDLHLHDVKVSGDLAEALVGDIDAGSTFEDIVNKYGDRLRGNGIDLDVWLSRLGNGSSVLSLLMQVIS